MVHLDICHLQFPQSCYVTMFWYDVHHVSHVHALSCKNFIIHVIALSIICHVMSSNLLDVMLILCHALLNLSKSYYWFTGAPLYTLLEYGSCYL